MFRVLVLFTILFTFTEAYTQNADPKILASAGESFASDNYILDWTLGESVVERFEIPTLLLTQGFHQADYNLVSTEQVADDIERLNVFPNPFTNELSIMASFDNVESGQFNLFNMQGGQIWTRNFSGKELLTSIPTTELSSGAYLLMLTVSGKTFIYKYKLLKTQ